jgi:hypothetical protein
VTLKPEDAAFLISQTRSEKAVLVGGQAVAFWVKQFSLRPRLPALTVDIDFLATRAEAKRIAAGLSVPHVLKTAMLDDNTPNSAVLLVKLDGYPRPILIDFMAGIVGVDSKGVEKSAVEVEFDGQPLRIIHPLHLLQSKIGNLYHLGSKRTEAGIEQARLAIEIAASFLEHATLAKRERLKAIESIGRYAATAPARYAAENFGLDCLDAVPASLLRKGALPEDFLKRRWPQILASAAKR